MSGERIGALERRHRIAHVTAVTILARARMVVHDGLGGARHDAYLLHAVQVRAQQRGRQAVRLGRLVDVGESIVHVEEVILVERYARGRDGAGGGERDEAVARVVGVLELVEVSVGPVQPLGLVVAGERGGLREAARHYCGHIGAVEKRAIDARRSIDGTVEEEAGVGIEGEAGDLRLPDEVASHAHVVALDDGDAAGVCEIQVARDPVVRHALHVEQVVGNERCDRCCCLCCLCCGHLVDGATQRVEEERAVVARVHFEGARRRESRQEDGQARLHLVAAGVRRDGAYHAALSDQEDVGDALARFAIAAAQLVADVAAATVGVGAGRRVRVTQQAKVLAAAGGARIDPSRRLLACMVDAHVSWTVARRQLVVVLDVLRLGSAQVSRRAHDGHLGEVGEVERALENVER